MDETDSSPRYACREAVKAHIIGGLFEPVVKQSSRIRLCIKHITLANGSSLLASQYGGFKSDGVPIDALGLISWHAHSLLFVWTRPREAVIMSCVAVSCISSWQEYLVSGSYNNTIKVWGMGGPGSWPCLGTITVHSGIVRAAVVWQGRIISGSWDKKICICSIVTRQHEATLDAHIGFVVALAV